MFVRWKRRKRTKRNRDTGKVVFSAVLVESYREDGKPRQRHIRYLASVRPEYATAHAWRVLFWRNADWHLDDLGLKGSERTAIEAKLLEVVKRPNEESQAEDEKLRAILARL